MYVVNLELIEHIVAISSISSTSTWKSVYNSKKYILNFLTFHRITYKGGSAAVVRATCCSYGKVQILQLSIAETTEPINTKFWTIDYLGEVKRIAKFGYDRFKGSVSPSGWNITNCDKILGSLIRLQTTIRNGFWCTMAQKIRFGTRMCLLSIRSVKIWCKGVKIAKIWLSREIQAKTNVRKYAISLG